MKIKSALIQFNEHGTPVAPAFDDVYFSNDDGAAETEHVFIKGNQLHKRFVECKNNHFVIAETGFGTGLNCAKAIEAFATFRQQHPEHVLKRLHMITVEKFPLNRVDLERALQQQPSSETFKTSLVNQYPLALSGAHRLSFGNVTIDLWFGEAIEMFASLAQHSANCVDAWFLDGFAPSKNPDMWSQDLFNVMAKLSAPDATLATFTAAGFVRRGLIDAGFQMQKAPGFGRKREMLVGQFADSTTDFTPKPYENTQQPHIAVIGAGLAGANIALSLSLRGCKVTVFDKGDTASGASGNPQGGFYPQLHAQISHPSMIQALSFDFAKRRYQLLKDLGYNYAGDFCGVLQLGFSDGVRERQTKMKANAPWPEDLVQFVDDKQASELAGVALNQGGIFFEQGGWISPPELVNALLKRAQEESDVELRTHQQVINVETNDNGADVTTVDKTESFDHVVITTGADDFEFDYLASLPFGRTRGQVESVPATTETRSLRTVLCHKGYFTPALSGRQALGSTYVRNDTQTDYRHAEADTNLATHQKALPDTSFVENIEHDYTGRAAIRMTLPDHQPVVGAIFEKNIGGRMSVLCGLGSRGLTTAPLMAEVLASELLQEPLPIAKELYEAVHHTRFAKRAAKRS